MNEDDEFDADEKSRIAALHKTAPEIIWLQIDPEAEQFDGWDAQTWCSDRINDTDLKYVRTDLVESLRQQLTEAQTCITEKTSYIDWLNGHCSDGWDKADELSGQLADSQKQVTLLRSLVPKRIPNGFVSFGKYYSEQEDKFNDPYNSMCKFKRKYLSDCEEALAATADLDGMILCHAEPVFKQWIVNGGKKVSLYRQWEPK